ncbi:MAG: hypothetical protein J6M22_05020 [Firmicutes bacterium]|nr:hypothetical protein [Bacillota bacterium]
MIQYIDFLNDEEEDCKYQILFEKLNLLVLHDPIYMKDLKDSMELEERFSKLPISNESRNIISDYLACLLSLSARMTELAYQIGKQESSETK